jgi:lipopolysaccharide/colanic/teichoic acid biosynthesis glycosyltransferase
MVRVAALRLLIAAVGPAAAAATAVERGHPRVVLSGRSTDGSGWSLVYPTSSRPRPQSAPQEDLARPGPGPGPVPQQVSAAGVLIGYARCSTDKQDLAAQRHMLRQLGVSDDRVYLDHGMTGRNRRRPGLQQALAAVRKGDTLVVPKLELAGARGHYSRQMRVAYRIVDIGISAIGLTVMAPALMIVAVALRLARPGPILSRDTRIGDHGPFHQLRFRTRSHHTRPDHGLGQLLERAALDQLPQMINVLRGDMSVIGTPAHPTRDGRTSIIDGTHRLSVRPGLTSWQLLCALGAVDMTPSEARARDRERGLRNDVALMLRTCRLSLTSRN